MYVRHHLQLEWSAVRQKISRYVTRVKAHPSHHPDKVPNWLNITPTRQQWSRWRSHRDLKWWCQTTDDTMHEQVQDQLILLPICNGSQQNNDS